MRYNLIGVTVLKKPEFHCCDLCGTKHRNVYTVEKVLDEGEDDQEAFPKSIGSECYSKRIESLLPADFDDAGRTRSVNKELSLAEKYARLATEELLFVFQVGVACSKARKIVVTKCLTCKLLLLAAILPRGNAVGEAEPSTFHLSEQLGICQNPERGSGRSQDPVCMARRQSVLRSGTSLVLDMYGFAFLSKKVLCNAGSERGCKSDLHA